MSCTNRFHADEIQRIYYIAGKEEVYQCRVLITKQQLKRQATVAPTKHYLPAVFPFLLCVNIFGNCMASRRSKSIFTALKIFAASLTLFFVIIAISSEKLSGSSRAKVPSEISNYLRSTGRARTYSMSVALSRTAPVPLFLYGTAWKKERTEELVDLAIRKGFRGIDTACQPKHYYEPGVGNALEKLYADGIVKRSDIFLQTKYTPYNGQDPNNVPYDKNAMFPDQVMQSYRASLTNLKTSYIDSLVLHSPLSNFEDTMLVWRAFENIHTQGGALSLGISNCYDLETLESLYSEAKVKPSFLQNRFYAESGYDRTIRTFCSKNDIKYQGFWTLTANPKALQSQVMRGIAEKYGMTSAQIFFKFLQTQDIIVLTGTKDETHMLQVSFTVLFCTSSYCIAVYCSVLYYSLLFYIHYSYFYLCFFHVPIYPGSRFIFIATDTGGNQLYRPSTLLNNGMEWNDSRVRIIWNMVPLNSSTFH